MTIEYYIVNKYIASAKVSAAFALLAFFLSLLTGIIYGNLITYVFIRSSIAMVVFGIIGYIMGFLLANTFTKKWEETIHEPLIDKGGKSGKK
jgi:positive regulator of sigma E activity